MPTVKILPETLINKIAAGEVVERPASVVKELVENSIDAGADQIFVTIKNGGKDLISVIDNGCGMAEADAKLAVERHATSKIEKNEDLYEINTLGFRGEALAAIAAVSNFELTTCEDEALGGFQIRIDGGRLKHMAKVGFPKGTRFNIENLFFNTPARQKFMKATNTEYNHIYDLIIRFALGHPEIQFRLTHNKSIVLNMPKGQEMKQRINDCFGSSIANDLFECRHEESYLSFHGYFSFPEKSRSSRRWQHTFVNQRYVKCTTINHGIMEGYKTLLMKNMHPMFFVNVTLHPTEIDVNVHPAKTEIRVRNAKLIHTIFAESLAKNLKLSSRNKYFESPNSPTPKEVQLQTQFQSQETKIDLSPSVEPLIQRPVTKDHKENKTIKNSTDQIKIQVDPNDQLRFFDQTIPKKNPQQQKILSGKAISNRAEEPAEETPFTFSNFETKVTVPASSLQVDQSPLELIGQLNQKYILAQNEKQLILIDQHAAHERIRFEEIRTQFYARSLSTQPLLIPLIIELPPQDGIILEQNLEQWEKLGFIIEPFGGNDYSVKQIPTLLKDQDVESVIRDVIDEMAQFEKTGKLEEFYNEAFEKLACHSAIRASQVLTQQEMQSILNQLANINLQLHCPHGRPVLIEIGMSELDKRFKRIL